MTWRMLVSGLAALSLMSFAACGGSDKKDNEEEADASVVIQDSGVPEEDASLPPDDAGEPPEDAGEDPLDAGPGPSGRCPDPEKPYELAGKCYGENDDCDETFPEGCANGDAVYCNSQGKVAVIQCGEGTTCGNATDKLEISFDGNWAWGVDCMLPCDRSGDTFTKCGSDDYAGFELEYVCSRLEGGGFGAYWRDEAECTHGCDEDKDTCILLDPDEGKWCTPTAYSDYEAYPQHCTEDGVVVFCLRNEVVVGICDREAGYTCHALPDGSYAGCYNADDLCMTPGEVSAKQCFVQSDGKEYVVTYTCRETTESGIYVWKMNTADPSDYEQCSVNCVAASETEEAHCGQLDSRIGTECSTAERDAGNICGAGGVVLSCYSENSQRTWHVADNCGAKGETCLTTASGEDAACYGSSTSCTQGEADTHHCLEEEVLGTQLIMSFTYACTEMSDGSFHRISVGSENCSLVGCSESTGMCNPP